MSCSLKGGHAQLFGFVIGQFVNLKLARSLEPTSGVFIELSTKVFRPLSLYLEPCWDGNNYWYSALFNKELEATHQCCSGQWWHINLCSSLLVMTHKILGSHLKKNALS